MRRLSLICALSFGALLLSIGGHAQEAQEKKSLEQRVEALENQLSGATARMAGLTDALEAETAKVDQLIRFAQAQAKSAADMSGTLARSETAGFTAGINYSSREILLDGWRKQLDAIQKSAPANESAKEEPGKKGGKEKRQRRD